MFGFLRSIFGGNSHLGKSIVVVSGLPRSGTSMMMRMLDAGGLPIMTDGERLSDVDNPHGYFEVERIKNLEKETDKSYVRDARGKALKVISFLIRFLPEENRYKVIFMRRDLEEVIQSQNKMIKRLGSKDTTEEEAVKESYRNDIIRTRLHCKKQSNFDLLEIHYRKTIDDPKTTASLVNQFLGGTMDEQAMTDAVDSKLYRNKKA